MHKRISKSIWVVMGLLLATNYVCGAAASWQVDRDNPASPLRLVVGDAAIEVLAGIGPVYDDDNDVLGPQDYDIELEKLEENDGGTVFHCCAVFDEFKADYTLAFRLLDDNAMELTVAGTDNVSYFQIGRMTGVEQPCKQFYTGERDAEAHQHNDNYAAMIYIPTVERYFYGAWDKDYTNAARPRNPTKPRSNFLVEKPLASCDAHYGILTDGSRLPLKERYVFRVSEELWQAYGPVLNEPSEYGAELAEMVFFDGWTEKFCYGHRFLEFLLKAVPDKVKFYTILQHWAAWRGWDSTNPDAYRIPDHTTPWASYGTEEELHAYVNLAKQRGRVGVRCNYLHVNDGSWSYQEGAVRRAQRSSGEDAWFSDLFHIVPMLTRQEMDIRKALGTTAALHDQWGSVGSGYPVVNFDADARRAGTVAGVRQILREICTKTKAIHDGPLGSESLISEFLIGKYLDTGDYNVFNANQRSDFSPEYKLRRLHGLTTTHGMGLGYRHFYAGDWKNNKEPGQDKYFGSDIDMDSYRACEVLYGNGGYLFVKQFMRKVHALTECMTVGVAQRYYALQPLDYVKYSNGGRYRTIGRIIPEVQSSEELHEWYRRFHIRYQNGCHVWVNLDDAAFEVRTPSNQMITLGHNCWLVYTEDKDLLAYTALVNDPVVAGNVERVDFCEAKSLGIKYVNPRKLQSYQKASKPTVWVDGERHFVLQDPETTVVQMCK